VKILNIRFTTAFFCFICVVMLNKRVTLAQCTNTVSFPTAISAPVNNAVTTISNTSSLAQYSQVNNLVAGNRYVVNHTAANAFVTVRFNSPSGTVMAAGLAPLQFTATCSGTYYLHWNSGTACATASTTGISTISCISCGATNSAQCQFTALYGAATAPTTGTVNFSTCSWGGEYAPLNGAQAMTVYRLASSNPTDFVTVRQGAITGPVIASGALPLTFTTTVAGAYFCHWSTNAACGTQNVCRTTSVTYVSAGACAACPSAPNPGQTNATYTQVPVGGTTLLSLQNSSSVAATYQWQSGSSATGPWTNITGATSSTYNHTFTSSVWLRCVVTCGTSANSLPIQINLGPCIATSTGGGVGGFYGTIKSVTLNTLNHNGLTPLASPYFANYPTTTATTTLQGGLSYNLTVNSGYYNTVGAWFDWNNNSVYETTEYIALGSSTALAYWNASALINVPTTVSNGQINMRIRTEFTAALNPLTAASACSTLTYGETRDYKISLTAAVICNGVPNPGVIVSNSPSVCSGTLFNLNSSQLSSGLGLNLQWQSAVTAQGPWLDISGANLASLTTSLTQSTFYRLQTTCTNSGAVNWSNVLEISIVNNPCQCSVYPTYAALFTANEEISSVTVGSMSNTSLCSSAPQGLGSTQNKYSNFTGIVQGPIIDLGSVVNFSFSQTSCGALLSSNFFQFYIDYNQDGDFLDANELVYNQNVTSVGNHTKTGTFVAPLTATPGLTRMRIVNVQGPLSATNYAHTNYNFGETEDYCLTLVLPPPCQGTPAPGLTIASSSEIFIGQSLGLSLQNQTTGLGLVYQWQQGLTVNGPWVDILGQTSPTMTLTPNTSSWYQCVVQCTNTNLTAISTPTYVYVNPYCYPTYTNTTTSNCAISNVSISGTSLNNSSSAQVSSPYYTYYSNINGVQLTAGQSYQLGISGGNQTNQLFAAWIDFNDNNLFEANEKIANSTVPTTTNLQNVQFNYTLSCTALPGIHRMRLRAIQSTSVVSIDPCLNYIAGETEDYIVTILPHVPIQTSFIVAPNLQACTQSNYQYTAPVGMQNYVWQVSGQNGIDYQLQNGTNLSGNTLNLLFLTAGLKEISLNYSSPNGCISSGPVIDTLIVQAVQSLQPISGVSSLCAGSNSTFNNTTSGGIWSVSNTAYANINALNGVLTALAPGVVLVQYSVPNLGTWCPNSITTASVNVLQTPLVNSNLDATICSGESFNLGATVNYNTNCSHSIQLFDSNGDGWSNCSVNVLVNGSTVLSNITLSSGFGPQSFSFSATSGDQISVNFNPGQWIQEPYFNILDGSGNSIVANYYPGISGTWTGLAAGCPPLPLTWTYLDANGNSGILSSTTVTPSVSTTYFASATGSNGCIDEDALNLTVLPSPVSLPITLVSQLCIGSSSFATHPIPGGIWSTSNPSVATINSSTGQLVAQSPGQVQVSYLLTATNGCATSMSASLQTNALPIAVITSSNGNTICQGASLTLSGPNASSYAWNSGSSSQSITINNSGVYTLVVTDANGCVSNASAPFSVNVQPLPTASINFSGSTTFCQGDSIVLTANGGSTYLWNDNFTGPTRVVFQSGSYWVSATNSFGCSATSIPVQITVLPNPNAQIITSGPTTFCEGSSVVLSVNGSGSILWNTSSVQSSILVNNSGSYFYTLTNPNGCTSTSNVVSVIVNQQPNLPSIIGQNTVCEGSQIAFTNAYPGGVWTSSNASVAAVNSFGDVSGLNVGTAEISYQVNQNGCVAFVTKNIQVLVAPPANVNISGTTTFCQGGSVTLSAPLGFAYTWLNTLNPSFTQPSQAITVQSSGTYQVAVTNSFGCTVNSNLVPVNVVAFPSISPISGPTSLCLGSSSALSHLVTGGVWHSSSPAIASISSSGVVTANGLGSAVISYTLTNSIGCSTTVDFNFSVVSVPPTMISANGPVVFCSGGSVTLTAPQGFDYVWSTNDTSQTLEVDATGSYSVFISNGVCTVQSSPVSVSVNSLPVSSIIASNISICPNDYASLSAEFPAQTYLWSNGAVSPSIQTSIPGTYTLTTTNSLGCSSVSQPIVINAAPAPVISIAASGPTSFCAGNTVLLSASAAQNYSWSNGLTTPTIQVNSSGIYFVTATNSSGCSAVSNEIVVDVYQSFAATINPVTPTTVCEGSLVTLVSSPGANYLWSNGETTQGINVSQSDTITVLVTNSQGCNATSAPVVVQVLPNPLVQILPSGPLNICHGDTVTLNASGGFSYFWNNGVSSQSIAAVATGDYVVTATTSSGCSSTASVAVIVNEIPSGILIADGNNFLCPGEVIQLSAVPGNTYLWSPNGETTTEITTDQVGNYSCFITSPNGCVVQSDVFSITAGQETTAELFAEGLDSYTLNGIVYEQSGTYEQVLVNNFGCDSIVILNLTLTAGIENHNYSLDVFPNPAESTLNIKSEGLLASDFSVTDANGRIVLKGRLNSSSESIDISSLMPGMYYFVIKGLPKKMKVIKI
jgi:GEVED domain/Secretion system C-terminal sorting domain